MRMKIISSLREMQSAAEELRLQGKRIGLVPTMGYLHEGHLSLVKIAREKSNVVILSIFVNPTQFGPEEDFEKYPRDLERDRRLAESAGCDILFVPEVAEMYGDGYLTFVEVEELSSVLEGKFRPTHFRGVTTVVAKLLNLTKPHVAVFGQKDAQQAVIIKKMVSDLNFDVEIAVAPIVREPDGLALSSRNVYLSPEEKRDALVLKESLGMAESMVQKGEREARKLLKGMEALIRSKKTAKLDYVAIVDSESLRPVDTLLRGQKVLVAVAARIGKTRLIDNTLIKL
jgi:pantoate--beta-alanine ligase